MNDRRVKVEEEEKDTHCRTILLKMIVPEDDDRPDDEDIRNRKVNVERVDGGEEIVDTHLPTTKIETEDIVAVVVAKTNVAATIVAANRSDVDRDRAKDDATVTRVRTVEVEGGVRKRRRQVEAAASTYLPSN